MYAEYFNLAEIPFRLTPDPRFLWYSDQHQEAKNKIMYHVTQSAGPIYLLADIGTGKTSIARRIMNELADDKKRHVVSVLSPRLRTTNSFLRFVMDEYGVKTKRAYARSLRNFEEYLIQQHESGYSPILLVDEAQNMTRDMLLLIQHLFNFSTNTEFLIQMALFAQPELQPKLDRLPSLKSRMSVSRLKPFNLEETREMMRFRWSAAGGNKDELPFPDNVTEEIYRLTEGVPRKIVKLANEALIKTAVEQRDLVSKEDVHAALSEVSEGSF